MNPVMKLAIGALALAACYAHAGPSSRTFSTMAQDSVWSCESLNGPTVYVSTVFRATSTRDAVQNAFSQILVQNYHYTGAVDCAGAFANQTPIEKIQSDQKNRVAQLRGVGRTVVETGWSFDTTTASLPYFCYGSVTVTQAGHASTLFYLTNVFRVTGSDRLTVEAAWYEHLTGLHPGFGANAHDCVLAPPDEDATLLQHTTIAQHQVEGMQVITDAWLYSGETAHQDDRVAYFCEAASGDHKTIYLSRVESAGAGFDQAAASRAWGTYVTKTLGLGQAYAQAACESGPMALQQRTRAGRIEQQHSVAGYTVNEIDWKYGLGGSAAAGTSGAAAAAAPTTATPHPSKAQSAAASPATPPSSVTSAAAPSASVASSAGQTPIPSTHAASAAPPTPLPQTHAASAPPSSAPPKVHEKNPWVCQADAYAGTKRTHYISGPFDSDETQQQLVPAWRAHLVSAYQLPGQVVAHCGRLPKQSEDAIEAALAKNQNVVPLVHDRWQP
jgi:hypothetical protein